MTSHTTSLENTHKSSSNKLNALITWLKLHRNLILTIVSVILIIVGILLTRLIINRAFTHFFSCTHLVNEALNSGSLCQEGAVTIGPFTIPPDFTIGPYTILGKDFQWDFKGISIPPIRIPVLPPLEPITTILEPVRRFVAWNVIIAIAAISLVLAFIAIKIKVFINLLRTPEGRKTVLTNISILLLIFAFFLSLFYFRVVAR